MKKVFFGSSRTFFLDFSLLSRAVVFVRDPIPKTRIHKSKVQVSCNTKNNQTGDALGLSELKRKRAAAPWRAAGRRSKALAALLKSSDRLHSAKGGVARLLLLAIVVAVALSFCSPLHTRRRRRRRRRRRPPRPRPPPRRRRCRRCRSPPHRHHGCLPLHLPPFH